MHPAAFYFSCTYTHGISLRIIIKDSIITQTLKTQNRKFKSSFILRYFDYCSVIKISENYCSYLGPCYLHICRTATSYWYTNSTLYEIVTFWCLHKNTLAILFDKKFTIEVFFSVYKNCKDTKNLNNFSCCIKTIENIIQSIIYKIIYH